MGHITLTFDGEIRDRLGRLLKKAACQDCLIAGYRNLRPLFRSKVQRYQKFEFSISDENAISRLAVQRRLPIFTSA